MAKHHSEGRLSARKHRYRTDPVCPQAFGGRAEDPEGSEGRVKFDAGIKIGSRGLLIDAVAGKSHSFFLFIECTNIFVFVMVRLSIVAPIQY